MVRTVVRALGAAALGVVAAGGGVALVYRVRIDGFTGDALGAAVELGELVHLGVIYAALLAWRIG